MRLLQDGVQITGTWDVPVAGLDPEEWHEVTICYSAENQVFSATVTPDGGAAQSCHAKDVVTTAGVDTSKIRLVTDKDFIVDYKFDNAVLTKTKTQETGDFGTADDCPCCGGGCSYEADDFEDATISCLWDQDAAVWNENIGALGAGDI